MNCRDLALGRQDFEMKPLNRAARGPTFAEVEGLGLKILDILRLNPKLCICVHRAWDLPNWTGNCNQQGTPPTTVIPPKFYTLNLKPFPNSGKAQGVGPGVAQATGAPEVSAKPRWGQQNRNY